MKKKAVESSVLFFFLHFFFFNILVSISSLSAVIGLLCPGHTEIWLLSS